MNKLRWRVGDGKNDAEWCLFKDDQWVGAFATSKGIFPEIAREIVDTMNRQEAMLKDSPYCSCEEQMRILPNKITYICDKCHLEFSCEKNLDQSSNVTDVTT